jgi:hypothetical protein
MITNACIPGAIQLVPDEIVSLKRALDRAYIRLRERARSDWERHYGRKSDPTNAIVRVRITASTKPASSAFFRPDVLASRPQPA